LLRLPLASVIRSCPRWDLVATIVARPPAASARKRDFCGQLPENSQPAILVIELVEFPAVVELAFRG